MFVVGEDEVINLFVTFLCQSYASDAVNSYMITSILFFSVVSLLQLNISHHLCSHHACLYAGIWNMQISCCFVYLVEHHHYSMPFAVSYDIANFAIN